MSIGYLSLPVQNIQPGPALVTIFVNGIPSLSRTIVVRMNQVYLPLVLSQ